MGGIGCRNTSGERALVTSHREGLLLCHGEIWKLFLYPPQNISNNLCSICSVGFTSVERRSDGEFVLGDTKVRSCMVVAC